MADDFIPEADAEFDVWQKQLHTGLAGVGGIDAALAAEAAASKTEWDAAFAGHVEARAAARAARARKAGARRGLEKSIRHVSRYLQALPTVSDAARADLGLSVRDPTPTRAAPPAEAPAVTVQIVPGLGHALDFRRAQTGVRKKPPRVRGCEIWLSLGVPPDGAPQEKGKAHQGGNMRFVAVATASPYRLEFDSGDAGKTAYYLLRWISTRGEPGPWSAVVQAMVVG